MLLSIPTVVIDYSAEQLGSIFRVVFFTFVIHPGLKRSVNFRMNL